MGVHSHDRNAREKWRLDQMTVLLFASSKMWRYDRFSLFFLRNQVDSLMLIVLIQAPAETRTQLTFQMIQCRLPPYIKVQETRHRNGHTGHSANQQQNCSLNLGLLTPNPAIFSPHPSLHLSHFAPLTTPQRSPESYRLQWVQAVPPSQDTQR